MSAVDRELAGKVAVVTGASRRMGRATALGLARHGASVVVNARAAREEVEAVAAEIRSEGGRAIAHLADVTDEKAVGEMIARASSEFGGVDILVNNAAIRPTSPLTEMSLSAWREVLAIILDGAFLCSRASIPSMISRGGGVVINIGGLTGHTGAADRAHVISAKAGLVGLTKAIAVEYGDRNIRANCVVPGRIRGPRSVTAGHSVRSNLPNQVPLGHEGTSEDVANTTLWLTLPSAAYVSGQTIHVNGGLYLP